jgi:nitrite reductase/ring-hydroxylating ferredoxin subunit
MMDRKGFIKTCGLACMGASGLALFLQSCEGSKSITAKFSADHILVPLRDFEIVKNKMITYRKYIIVQNEKLQYPIYVYRFSEEDYSALYMRCTHQGTELTAFGDKLVCSAHGSEFDNRGNVQTAPAESVLRSFPVVIENKEIKISLKAI